MSKHGNILMIFSVLLIFLLLFMGFRYRQMVAYWSLYSDQLKSNVTTYETRNSQEDAEMINTTIMTLPSVANPLYKQPQALQSYVTALSNQTKRDIVIVDNNKQILADTIPANVGQKYMEDKKKEVLTTIAGGLVHVFVEKSKDYPQGINQTVIPMKNITGNIIGAIIISNSTIFQK